MVTSLLRLSIQPDFDALRANILRQGTPKRVHYMELYQDQEIKDLVAARYDLEQGLDPGDPAFAYRREIAIQRFLGYELVAGALSPRLPVGESAQLVQGGFVEDTTTATRQSRGQRQWANEHEGVIGSWRDFEEYRWADPVEADLSPLDWAEKNLPEGMRVYVSTFNLFELVTALFGYKKLCLNLYDAPDLVDAVCQKVGELRLKHTEMVCDYGCVGMLFGGDDMGFKTSLLVPKDFLLDKIFPWYRRIVSVAHRKGKLAVLHCCGNIEGLMDEIINHSRFDGRHSFEDAITPVTEAKGLYGDRIALIGGIDMDFLCRATPDQIRVRVRDTLDICHPGGGYCLGTGNTVANYVPLENYLTMLDEGRRYSA